MLLEDRLRRIRWGLKFVQAETEGGYRAWHQRVTIPFTRAGMALSLVNWAAVLGVQVLVFERGMEGQIAAEILVVCPVIAACLFSTYRPSLLGWTLPLISAANGVAGFQGVWLGLQPAPRADFCLAAATVIGFFGFTIFRLPPLRAAVTVGSYYALALAAFVSFWSSGALDGARTLWYAVTVNVSFTSGLAACMLIDRLSRDSYAQEQVITAQREAIELERNRADKLLTSILPTAIAEQLKKSSEMIAAHHPEVTVLFADIVGFTPMAAALTPDQLVRQLNLIFTSFDELAARLGAEKIKTIGDAYMAVAGAPEARADHAAVMAELALGMQAVVGGMLTTPPISIRIGLSTGPAVAGVIGARKFAYDLWGDTVNTAARMESHGVPGGIHVTEATKAKLEGSYAFDDRGVAEIKGKGPMRTWLLTGRSPAPTR